MISRSPIRLGAAPQQRHGCVEPVAGCVKFHCELVDLFLRCSSNLAKAVLLRLEQWHRDRLGVVRLQQLSLLSVDPLQPDPLVLNDSLLLETNNFDESDYFGLHSIEVILGWLESTPHLQDLGFNLVNGEVRQGTAVLAVAMATKAEEVGVLAAVPLVEGDPESRPTETAGEDPLQVMSAGYWFLLANASLVQHLLHGFEGGRRDQGIMPTWVLHTVVGDDADVVGVAQHLVDSAATDGSLGESSRRP